MLIINVCDFFFFFCSGGDTFPSAWHSSFPHDHSSSCLNSSPAQWGWEKVQDQDLHQPPAAGDTHADLQSRAAALKTDQRGAYGQDWLRHEGMGMKTLRECLPWPLLSLSLGDSSVVSKPSFQGEKRRQLSWGQGRECWCKQWCYDDAQHSHTLHSPPSPTHHHYTSRY